MALTLLSRLRQTLAAPMAPMVLIAGLALFGVTGHALAAPLSVFVSVLPLQGLVERIGGERVAVQVMVRPGQDPHNYEPTPRQVAALADAALYLRAGMPFEAAWMRRITATNPALTVVDLRDGIALRVLEAHDHDHGHHDDHEAHEHAHDHAHAGPDADAHTDERDPHIWTSPTTLRQMVVSIRDALSALDPAGAEGYAANQAAFDAELAALDQELAATLAGLEHRSFLVYHPAWGYFADAYDLTQVAIERAGKEPGARSLATLIDQARASDARLVLVQPQFDQRAATQVAAAIGGRVASADPLAVDIPAELRELAALLVAAERGNDAAR